MSKGREKAVTMTDEEYIEVFFLPAMQLIAAEKADTLGALLVRWLCIHCPAVWQMVSV
jgi:hypothetical protein